MLPSPHSERNVPVHPGLPEVGMLLVHLLFSIVVPLAIVVFFAVLLLQIKRKVEEIDVQITWLRHRLESQDK